jgi:hypothetical protein
MSAPNIINPPSGGGGGGGISGSGSSPYVAVWSGTSAITTGSLVDTGSRVGILQTSPVTTFQVGGNTVATASPVGAFCTLGSNSRFTADDGTRAVTLAANGTDAIVGTTTAHDLVLQRGGVEAARIIAGGLVGFGNTNPAATIEAYAAVTGEVRASGDTVSIVSSYTYNNSVAAFAPFVRLSRSRGTRAAPAAVNALDTIGVVQWQARGTTDRAVANMSCTAPANAGGDQISGQLTFATAQTTDALPVVRLTIDPAGVASFAGPVRATGTAATAPAFTGSDTNTGMYFPANDQVRLSTAGNVAIAVDATQNVGVQTASPAYPLHVGGGNNTGIVTTGPAAYVATNGATSLVVRDATNGIESFLYCGSSVVLAGAATNHPYQIRTANATRITISAAGDTSIANTLSFNSGFGSAAVAYGTRAWVNFNGGAGATPPSIRASGNVSSVTDTAVGQYVVNMTNAMPDTNFVVSAATQWGGGPYIIAHNSTFTVNSVNIVNGNAAGTSVDVAIMCVTITR